MKTKRHEVTFEGQYFKLMVEVASIDSNRKAEHDDIVNQAVDLIESQYGWDLNATGNIYFITHVAEIVDEDDE